MSNHLKPAAVSIQIERLTTGTWIKLPEFAWLVQVADIAFDGEGYSLSVTEQDWRSVTESSWSEDAYVMAGGSVEFAGIGEPVLRGEQFVSRDEWAAKADAIEAGNLELQGRLNAAQGHVCQPVDETALVDAVAAAVGAPALMAAE